MAFISSSKHNSRDEDGNTAYVSTSSTTFPTASASVATISQDTVSAYIDSQSNGSQIKFEDINQIDEDDMEEMDIKWSMELLSMRADKFWKKTGKKISIQGSDVAGFDKSKVECFNCHKMGHFIRECRAPRSQERGRKDNYRQGSKTKEKTPKALMAIDRSGWDWSYMANKGEDHALVADVEAPTKFALMANTETRLVEYKEREVKYIKKIRTLEMYRESNLKCIETLGNELETLKHEKDGVDGKLAGLLKASKNLDNLIESQRSDKDVASPNTPKPFVKFVKPKDSQSESKTNKQETSKKPQVKYAEQYRHSNKKPNVKGNQRSWNNSKSYQLGLEFVLIKKVCFNCGDFSYLANECRKRVQRETTRSQDHSYVSPLHRFAGHRPHGAPMRPPHRSAGHRQYKASMRPSYRPAGHRPHGPSMNPMRPNMNGARPNRSFFIQAHSYETWPFLKSSTVKTQYRAPWVPTVNRNNPPVNRKFSTGRRNFPTINRKFPTASKKFTTSSTKIHTADMGRKGKAGSSQNNIDDKGYWDSGCSRHMTGNISYLFDFEPFDGGYVSFGQGGCKITDDANILLRTPRQNNMYSIDLNNIIPHKDLTCLVAKAFADEYILWHRRLDNIGKFEAKGDEGYFIGYSMSSKAFRVFNKRTKRVEENLHVEFLENKVIENGIKDAASQEVKKDVSFLRYIALPNWVHDALLKYSSSKLQDGCSPEVPEGGGNTNPTASTSNPSATQMETLTVEISIPTVSSPVPTACLNDSLEPSSDARLISKRVANQEETPSLDSILSLTNRFEDILGVTTSSYEAIGMEADVSNMDTTISASPTPTLKIHKDHPKSQIIGPVDTPIQTRNKSKEVEEQSFIATIYQKTDPTLLQFCLFSCFLSQVEPKKVSDAL
nr:hypothetical protein [Tanacetum cinerariifolium]